MTQRLFKDLRSPNLLFRRVKGKFRDELCKPKQIRIYVENKSRGTAGGWAKITDQKKIDFLKQARVARDWVRQKSAALQLMRIAKSVCPTLSSNNQLEKVTVELEERLQKFKQDVDAGYFVS